MQRIFLLFAMLAPFWAVAQELYLETSQGVVYEIETHYNVSTGDSVKLWLLEDSRAVRRIDFKAAAFVTRQFHDAQAPFTWYLMGNEWSYAHLELGMYMVEIYYEDGGRRRIIFNVNNF